MSALTELGHIFETAKGYARRLVTGWAILWVGFMLLVLVGLVVEYAPLAFTAVRRTTGDLYDYLSGDVGAKIRRDCTSVVKAARAAEGNVVSRWALEDELRQRGVTILQRPTQPATVEEGFYGGKKAYDEAKEVYDKAKKDYDDAWARLRQTTVYSEAFDVVADREQAKRIKDCVAQRAKAFERGAR